jgi:hypothetical protein
MPPECFSAKEARGRRTPSRFTTPHERAPQLDEVMRSLREVWKAGIRDAS